MSEWYLGVCGDMAVAYGRQDLCNDRRAATTEAACSECITSIVCGSSAGALCSASDDSYAVSMSCQLTSRYPSLLQPGHVNRQSLDGPPYQRRAYRSNQERVLVFFFQAKDGIRDLIVTGVQTCALPISSRAGPASGSCPTSTATSRACARTRGSARSSASSSTRLRSAARSRSPASFSTRSRRSG